MKKMIKRLSVLLLAFVMVIGAIAPVASYAEASDDYVYGTVDMNYADFYYGELEGIEPSDATTIDVNAKDPVTEAGYREQGFYDAATLATPRGFIYEQKWRTGYPGTYNEPIYDDWGNLVGGRILGIEAVNVAVKKSVYDKAMKAPTSVVGQKAAEIKVNPDQSKVPLSYKVLNADGVYSKYVNLTESEEVALDGECTTAYMGDDIWWEGRAMKHTDTQTILGGVIEYKADPKDPNEKPVVLGLKHDENMYNDEWIGWGMGPGNVGIYGGNETGWERFSGISGKYLTKMSYILMEEDGSVHYYNATSEDGLLNPYIPSGIVEDGKHPYNVQMTGYEYTKDRIKLDFTLDVPVRADGTPEVDYYLNSINAPGGSLSCSGEKAVWKIAPEKMPVFEESEWVNGHKTIHVEINRKYTEKNAETGEETEKYFGTGRYKYWFYVNNDSVREGDRAFGRIAAWRMLYTDETPDDIYLKDNKLVVNSDRFTVKDYINNPYQQIEVYDAEGEALDILATGDANTNTNLFLGATKQDGTPVKGLFNEDGSINMDAELYSYNRRAGTESLTPVFEDPNGKYIVVLYSGGFPIVKGTLSPSRAEQTITAPDSISMKIGDVSREIGATAKTELSYKSDDESVATVDKNGLVTAAGLGSCNIIITAKESADYKESVYKVAITIGKADPVITASKTAFTVKAKALKKKAQKVTFKANSSSGGKLTYSKKSGHKKLSVAKNGKITVKKGTKKGTYTVKVAVTSAAKGNFDKGSNTFTVKIKVK